MKTYGHWTVLPGEPRLINRKLHAEAVCWCGRRKWVQLASLVAGRSKSCGCSRYNTEDPTGKKYGKLLIIAKMGQKVLCRCDCGKLKSVRFSNIASGNTRSCGCSRLCSGRRPRGAEPVRIICERLGISRAAYYARKKRNLKPKGETQ